MMKKVHAVVCLLSMLSILPAVAFAQVGEAKAKVAAHKPKDYPTQPIEFVVAFPAGGGMDFTARILAKHVEKYIDSRIIVVNKPGGGGLIGNTYLATQAANDGYTVGIPSTGILSDDLLKAKGAWSYKNLQALAFITEEPVTWIVSTAGPLKDATVKDVIDGAKQKPDTLKVAVIPDISFQWLAETVEMYTGGRFIIVPYQGGQPRITAMLGGHVDFATGYLPEYKGLLEAGKVEGHRTDRLGALALPAGGPHFRGGPEARRRPLVGPAVRGRPQGHPGRTHSLPLRRHRCRAARPRVHRGLRQSRDQGRGQVPGRPENRCGVGVHLQELPRVFHQDQAAAVNGVVMNRHEQALNLLWVLLGSASCAYSVGLGLWARSKPGSGLVPFLAGVIIGIVGLGVWWAASSGTQTEEGRHRLGDGRYPQPDAARPGWVHGHGLLHAEARVSRRGGPRHLISPVRDRTPAPD